MAIDTASNGSSRRVIIRAHEHWHDEYLQIVQDWFRQSGYTTNSEPYQWAGKHYVHLGGVNQQRFHLVIDMECDSLQQARIDDIPYELYRLKKPNELSSKFVFLDPQEQNKWYLSAREVTQEFTWGGRKQAGPVDD